MIRTIPASDSYPGLTGYKLEDTREVVAIGTGPEVEAEVMRKVEEVRDDSVSDDVAFVDRATTDLQHRAVGVSLGRMGGREA